MESVNFKNCEYFSVGDKVKLSLNAPKWKFGNTTKPQYIVDGLQFNKEYIVDNVTPIIRVSGGDQQFLSINSLLSTYPCYCFTKSI